VNIISAILCKLDKLWNHNFNSHGLYPPLADKFSMELI